MEKVNSIINTKFAPMLSSMTNKMMHTDREEQGPQKATEQKTYLANDNIVHRIKKPYSG